MSDSDNSSQNYDAHNSARPGELTFTLQAGDPYCAGLVTLWASLMTCEVPDVERALEDLHNTMLSEINLDNSFGNVQMDKGKVQKAYNFAIEIREHAANPDTPNLTSYDAHQTARTEEKTFTLQGGDPYCADMVELWASLMTGNINEVEIHFQQVKDTLLSQIGKKNPFGKDQIARGKVTKAYMYAAELKKQRHTADIISGPVERG